MTIKKILIANRGEIACRIIQTCQKLGIKTVAIYASIEAEALHVKQADESYQIQSASPTAAYLDADAIIKIAKLHEVDAIHPGYGFLSERSEFAQKIIDEDMIFIGAPIAALELMGSKAAAKKTMIAAGVQCVPGYHGDNQDPIFLQSQADIIGYPVLIKASAGGGGKGMKIVNQSSEFIDELQSAKREAIKSFANDHVILEKFITKPKHIEVQVFADAQGNVVHLFERDCSSQRRYQKIIEEAPATCINQETKDKMYDAAINATKAVDYQGAGTIEFIVEGAEFYFMEMNTRLQVEHRVTELITDTDLVQWQIHVANGNDLPLKQEQIRCNGYAIQARIYAEDPYNDFLPATGLIEKIHFQQGDNCIIDTAIEANNNISIHFDPMIAKTVCWSKDRQNCINFMLDNLAKTVIFGVKTNLPFLSKIIASERFQKNEIYTNSIDIGSISLQAPKVTKSILATLIHAISQNKAQSAWSGNSGWSNTGLYSNVYSWLSDGKEIKVKAKVNNQFVTFENDENIQIHNDAIAHQFNKQNQLIIGNKRYIFDEINHLNVATTQNNGDIFSPMPGKILQVKVKAGQHVKVDQTLVVMEAMKMELALKAETDAIVEEVFVQENQVINANLLLVKTMKK